MIRAAARLVATYPTLACLIVGATAPVDQPYEDRLQAMVREHGLEANVIFCGYQKFPADFVNVMDVVIHASIEPEPFGMVVLEAMGMRKPLIGSRAGGVPEMVVEGVTGYTYPPATTRPWRRGSTNCSATRPGRGPWARPVTSAW